MNSTSPADLATAPAYSTRALPPDCGRRRFLDLVKDVPGAYQIGNVWMCPRDQWLIARANGLGRGSR